MQIASAVVQSEEKQKILFLHYASRKQQHCYEL